MRRRLALLDSFKPIRLTVEGGHVTEGVSFSGG
jgi:hypothetical protein